MNRRLDKTTSFLVDPDNVGDDQLVLVAEEADHAAKVLRARVGTSLRVVDGVGTAYGARILSIGKHEVMCEITSMGVEEGEAPYDLSMYCANIKSRNRLETLVEKMVELGVAKLSVIETSRSVVSQRVLGRFERIVRSATKQCGRSRFMEIESGLAFADVLARDRTTGFLLHEAAPATARFSDELAGLAAPGSGQRARSLITALVGPEGGFTDEEVTAAVAAGFAVVRLGDRRLRSETAALSVAASIHVMFGNGTERRIDN